MPIKIQITISKQTLRRTLNTVLFLLWSTFIVTQSAKTRKVLPGHASNQVFLNLYFSGFIQRKFSKPSWALFT